MCSVPRTLERDFRRGVPNPDHCIVQTERVAVVADGGSLAAACGVLNNADLGGCSEQCRLSLSGRCSADTNKYEWKCGSRRNDANDHWAARWSLATTFG